MEFSAIGLEIDIARVYRPSENLYILVRFSQSIKGHLLLQIIGEDFAAQLLRASS